MRHPLDIHVWGGFGSQLNGLALGIYLIHRGYRRPIRFIFHTSGVTKRPLEIADLIAGDFYYEQKDDFSPDQNQTNNKTGASLRSFANRCSQISRFIIRVKTIEDLNLIAPWTLQLRGHYAYCQFDEGTLSTLCTILDLDQSRNSTNDPTVLHYRLGDLLNIDKESITGEELGRLLSALKPQTKLLVFTESTQEAKSRLSPYLTDLRAEFLGSEISSLRVLQRCVQAPIFIGTNSKISIWATVLRCHLGLYNSYVPISLKISLQKNLTDECLQLVNFF